MHAPSYGNDPGGMLPFTCDFVGTFNSRQCEQLMQAKPEGVREGSQLSQLKLDAASFYSYCAVAGGGRIGQEAFASRCDP